MALKKKYHLLIADVYIDKITFQGDGSEEGRRSKNYELQRKIRAVAEQ